MSEIELRPDGGGGPLSERTKLFERLRAAWTVLHDATAGLFRHDGVMVASAISYSLIFAIFPFAIFLVALGAVVGGAELGAYISHEALAVLPENVIKTLEPELNRIFAVANRARPLTFGLAVTLVSITGAVEAIRDGLNRAYGCAEDRHFARRYISSLLFVFFWMAFMLFIAAFGILVPILIGMMQRYVPSAELETRWLEIGREAVLIAVTFVMLLGFHLFLPARRRRVKSVIGGILFTLVGWWLAGKVFGFYIGRIANYSATYAGLAGIVILMLFLYIQALIFLYGAEFNRSLADFRGAALCRKDS